MKKNIRYLIILALLVAIAVILIRPETGDDITALPGGSSGELLTEDPYSAYIVARAEGKPIFLEFYARW